MRFDVLVNAIPPEKRLDGKSVTQVMKPGTAGIVWPAEASLARDTHKPSSDHAFGYAVALFGKEKPRARGLWTNAIAQTLVV
jgi:hypothetical protein